MLYWQSKVEYKYDDSFCIFDITFLKAKIENIALPYLAPPIEEEENGEFEYKKLYYDGTRQEVNFTNFVFKDIDNQNIPTDQYSIAEVVTLTSQDALIFKNLLSPPYTTITPLKTGIMLITGQIINPKIEPLTFVQILNAERGRTIMTLNGPSILLRSLDDQWPIETQFTTNNNESPVLFTSSDPSVATVDNIGQISPVGYGTSVITLSQAASPRFTALENNLQFKIYITDQSRATNPINFNDIPLKYLEKDEDINFPIIIQNNQNNLKPIFYTSSNSGVAEIDQYGWITLLSDGWTKIGIFQEAFDNYNLAFVQKYLYSPRGRDNNLLYDPLYVAPISNKLVGESYDLVLKISASSNDAVPLYYYNVITDGSAIINVIDMWGGGAKRITFLRKGSIKLSIVPNDTYNYSFKPFDITVIVSKGPQNITFNNIPTKYYGNPPFSLEVSSNNSTIPITYSSSNTSVATVNSSGVVTVISVGSTTITASQASNTNWESASISKTLIIYKTQRNINFPDIPNKNYQGSNFNLNVTSSDYEVPITYASSNTSIATVNEQGVVIIVGVGSTTITASQAESASFSSSSVGKTIQVNKINAIITFPQIGNKVYQDPNFNLNVTSTNQVTQIIYSSSNTSVATVNSSGVVTVISAGSTIITASQASSNNYNAPLSVARTLLVTKKTPTFNFPIIPEKSSNSAPFSIGVTSNNSISPIVYSISNLLVATINQVGLVSIIGEGTTSIQVSQEETANWTSAVLTRELQIIKPNPLVQTNIRYPKIIKLSNLPNNIFYNPIKKYLQGYLQDEGTYNIKIYIEENGVVCEKILSINAFKRYKKYIYPVNYPINVGFIKYNPHERIGLQPKIEAYDHPIFGKILRHSDLGIIYTKLSDSNNGNSTNTDPDFLLIVTEDELEGSQEVMGYIDIQLKYSSSLDKNYLTINGYPIYFYKNDLDMYSTKGKNNNWTLFDQNGQRILV